MKRHLIICLTIGLITSLNLYAMPVGYVHRVFECPSAADYHDYLIKGTPISICPLDTTTQKERTSCGHSLKMQPLLDGYGGYAPKEGFTVVAMHGYERHQCHYIVEVTEDHKQPVQAFGHFLISDHMGENCYRSSQNPTDLTFYCDLPAAQQNQFHEDGKRL